MDRKVIVKTIAKLVGATMLAGWSAKGLLDDVARINGYIYDLDKEIKNKKEA